MVFSIAETVVTWQYMRYNFVGIHYSDIPKGYDITPGLKYNYAVQVLYNPILAIVKSSILLFLLRLSGQKRNVRLMIYALLVFNLLLMVIIFMIVIFQCIPIAANWDLTIEHPHCVKPGAFYAATSAITLLTDILVLILPFWILMGLKMPRKTKLAVIGIFFLGFLVTIVGVARLIIIVEGFFATVIVKDPTYSIGFTTSAIETNLSIITASAPAMKPLFRRWFPRFFSSSNVDYSSQMYGPNGTRRKSMGTGLKSGHGGFALKDMNGRSEIISHPTNGSEEEIMTMNGITKTTDVSVRYLEPHDEDNRSREEEFGGRTSIKSL